MVFCLEALQEARGLPASAATTPSTAARARQGNPQKDQTDKGLQVPNLTFYIPKSGLGS